MLFDRWREKSLGSLLLVHSVAKNNCGLRKIREKSKEGKTYPYLLRIQAISGDTLKNAVYVGWGAHKLVGPKIVLRVANEFYERDKNAPWMRLQQNQPLH